MQTWPVANVIGCPEVAVKVAPALGSGRGQWVIAHLADHAFNIARRVIYLAGHAAH